MTTEVYINHRIQIIDEKIIILEKLYNTLESEFNQKRFQLEDSTKKPNVDKLLETIINIKENTSDIHRITTQIEEELRIKME